MTWTVLFHDAFDAEFKALADARYDDHLGTLSQSTKESKNGKKTR
jgi:hypothetical protein